MSRSPSGSSQPTHCRRRLAVGLSLWMGLSAAAQPQPDQPQQPVGPPPRRLVGDELPSDAKETQSVTVNDAPEARKDIETARDMERQHQWNKAAGWYQEVLEKYRTRVVAWKADDNNTINRYRGIVYQVQEALAKWPADGIAAYRARYEPTAAALIESAKPEDAGALQAALDTYFITEAAKTAGLRLIDLHMEAGEYDAAARVGELLLSWYPADHLIAERPRLLYRTALAHHLCGDEKMAGQRADELQQKFADATGLVFGKDTVLSESLATLLKVAPALSESLSPDSWPTFNGSPDRSHVSPAQGHMGARIFSIELPPRPAFKGQTPEVAAARAKWQSDESEGRTLGIMPVVDGGSLFFQDGARVWAVGLDTGLPLPGWSRTYGGRGIYQLKNATTLRNQQFTLTLTDTAVLGVMGQSNRIQAMYANQSGGDIPGGDAGTKLVCLDRETGKERWKISMPQLAGDNVKDEEKERLRALDFSGSPLVVGDSVFIIGRGGKDVQFENCYCLCFDLNSGQYRWSCLVGSANTNFNMYGGGDPSQLNGTMSHLAYASGRLYMLTNVGALAAIDAATGSIVWLALYPRDLAGNVNDNMGGFMGGRRWRNAQPPLASPNLRPWELNPVLAQEGKLFVMPTDARFLLVYDAATGEEKKRINLEDFQLQNLPDRPRALLGIAGEWILLSGSERVYGVQWTKYDTTKLLQSNCEAHVAWASARHAGSSAAYIRGRSFVTADSVYLPTDRYFSRLSFKGGLKVAARYPTNRPEWDEKEGPGNVVVTGEHVIIAGKSSVDVYTDMALAQAKLEREVAADADAPDPLLHYGEVMFAAGQVPLSLDKLNGAARLLGGVKSLRPGPSRQRLFSDALTFAQKLAKDHAVETMDAAIAFFDLAGASADLPSEQVNYRLSRAQFARSIVEADSFATAVKLYQEILSRPDFRTIGVVPEAESRGIVQAAVEAEAQIADVIKKHPEAYEAIAKEAAAAMESAKAASDTAKLLEVAQTYPNAPVAPKAMLLAADAYERSKNPRLATHVLRQIYRKYGDTSDKDQIIEAMVRNYLTLPGGLDIAIARLEREKNFGDTKLTRPLVPPGGAMIENASFRDTIEQLKQLRPEEQAATVPDVHVPFFGPRLSEEERAAGKRPPVPFLPNPMTIADITALVQPPPDMPDAIRGDRVVAMAGNQLRLFAPGVEKPLGTNDALTDEPRAVWVPREQGKSALLAWSNNEVVLLDGDTAATIWTCPLKGLASSELITVAGMRNIEVVNDSVAPDPNADDNQQVFLNNRRQRLFLGGRRNGFVVRNAIAQPMIVADAETAVAGPEQIRQLQPLSDRMILGTSTGRLICLNAGDGKLVWQTRVTPKPIDRLVASEDFTAVKVTEDGSSKLIVLDNYNGQIQMVRNFGDPNMTPVNMALAADGMLVWTMSDRMCGKDLYEPDTRKLTFEYPPRNNNGAPINPIYFGCIQPGQLVIRGRQVIALEQLGRFVTIHSLEDGKLSPADKDQPLTTGVQSVANNQPGEVTTSFRIIGPYMYTFGPRSLIAYRLDDIGGKAWRAETGEFVTNPNFKQAIPTRDFVMMVGEPGGKKLVENVRINQLRFYSRGPTKGSPNAAAGRIEQIHDVAEPAGVTNWQAVDGGVYYLTVDHRLRFLRGTRE